MLQRNMSFDFAGPSRVPRYLLPLHFARICSGAALQQTCGFGHEPRKIIFSRKSTFLNIRLLS
jgi:hypothetical protein